jgi:glycosyltransferase involved in cell wall biosynthesis
MHVIYADTGLSSEVGHHANSCRAITAALRERGHTVSVAGHVGITQDLADALGAQRHFRLHTYWYDDGDPVSGWLNAFHTAAVVTADDFARLGPFRPDQLLFVSSIMPAQLLALRNFLAVLPDAARPRVFAELGTDPGLDHIDDESGTRFGVRNPRHDPRATLYRFAGLQLRATPVPQLSLCSFDRTSSEVYAMLLSHEVLTLPLPRFSPPALRRRGARAPYTVGVLGHQRTEKGFHLVPEMVELLLRVRGDVRFLVHNALPGDLSVPQDRLRALAAREPRLMLEEGPASAEYWQGLLDRCDVILCPYDAAQFRAGYSAVAAEALANAIPLVVPERTTMARMIEEFGGPGIAYAIQTPAGIAVAVNDALERLDDLANRALGGARQWQASMGAGNMVDAMLARAAGGDMLARLMQRREDAQAPEARPVGAEPIRAVA